MMKFILQNFILFIFALNIAACSSFEGKEGGAYPMGPNDVRRAKRGRLSGEGGIKLLGGDSKESGSTIGVNSFLWRASLDTLSFMPLASVDPLGGVIITDWHEDPKARGARFKMNVVILGTQLRADGVRISVFRQEHDSAGAWRDAEVGKDVARQLEDKVLTRARELRIASANK